MTNGRKNNTQKIKSSLIDEQPNTFPNSSGYINRKLTENLLPRKFKPFSKLQFQEKKNEDENTRQTANRRNLAVRVGKTPADGLYHFKHEKTPVPIDPKDLASKSASTNPLHHQKASLSEIEVVSAAWAKFLAPGCIPTMRVWYDDKTNEILGRTSKNIKNCKSNHDKPFREEDTVVYLNVEEEIAEDILKQRQFLLDTVQDLIGEIRTRKDQETSFGTHYLKNALNRSKSGETGIKLKDYLQKYLKTTPSLIFTEKKLQNLKNHLSERGNYITKYNNDAHHAKELEIIIQILNTIKLLGQLTHKCTVPLSMVPVMNELLKEAYRQGIDFDNFDANKSIEVELNKKKYSATLHYINNYRITSRQIYIWVVRYLLEDTDGHNQNFTRDGWAYDFDMAQLLYTYPLRDNNYYDDRVRKPNERTFIITAYDLEHFPCIKDANFYYFPVYPTKISESTFEFLSYFYKNVGNLFKTEHTIVFENLANQPPAIFAKFNMLLKYALCNADMFEGVARLHMRNKIAYDNKDLLTELVDHQRKRIEQVRNTLISMPSFQQILDMHGEYLLKEILEEFSEKRAKIENKIESIQEKNKLGVKGRNDRDTKPYERLLHAINLDEIKEEYKKIFIQTADFQNAVTGQKKNTRGAHEYTVPRNFGKKM